MHARRRGTPAPARWFSAVGPPMGINGTANEYSLTESFNENKSPKKIQLALSFIFTAIWDMKIQQSIHTNPVRRLALIFVICSMAFAACSEVAETAANHASISFQSPVTGRRQTGDNVTIGPRTYNSETRSFDRPWPFGPEGGAQ